MIDVDRKFHLAQCVMVKTDELSISQGRTYMETQPWSVDVKISAYHASNPDTNIELRVALTAYDAECMAQALMVHAASVRRLELLKDQP